MMGKYIDSLTKKTIIIPYEDSLVYPTTKITQDAISKFCVKEKFDFKFTGKNADDNMLVDINGNKYEILRFFAGRGGYAIHCRQIN